MEIISKLKRYKTLGKNFSYLMILQTSTILIQFFMYPYIIRTVGLSNWGIVVFAQNIVSFFNIFINFGLDIVSVKEISIHRASKKKLSEIFSAIFILRSLFFFMSLFVYIILVNIIPSFQDKKIIFYYSFCFCIAEWLLPVWFFQGIEKMQYITFITLSSKILLALCVFVFIKKQSDYYLIPLFNGIGSLLGGIIGLYLVFKKYKLNIVIPHINILKKYLYESIPIFLSKAVIIIKDKTNLILISSFLGTSEVAIYDIAERIRALISLIQSIINKVIYPKVSIEKNMCFVKKIIILNEAIIFCIVCFLQIFLKDIYILFTGNYIDNLLPIRILLLIPFITAFSVPLSSNCMLIFNHSKALLYGMILTTLFYLVNAVIIINYFQKSLLTYTLLAFCTFLFELGYRLIYTKKKKIF